MREVPVSDFAARVDYGVTASASKDPIGPKMLRITDLRESGVDWSTVPHCAKATKGIDARQLETGDIVFARTGSTGNSMLVRDCPEGAVFASYLIRLRVLKDLAEPGYVSHFFRSPDYWRQIAGASDGGVQKGVNASKLKKLLVPLPPLEEQRRIAAVLDATEALRAKRRQTLAKIDELAQAVFYDFFGDLSNNVGGWPVRRIGDFVDSFQTGKSIALGPSDVPGDFRVLKVSAVTSRRYKPWESKPVSSSYAAPETHLVRAGDLLISRANTTELVGACAYVETTPENHLLPDKLWRFVWCEPRQVEPLFVWRLLQGQRARKEIGDLATGSSGSMKNISQQKFMQLEVPIPPLSVQEEFVRRHREIRGFASSLDTGLASLDTLFASLQQRAFRGEL